MTRRRCRHIVPIELCWLVLVGAVIAVALSDTTANAETLLASARIHTNSNQTAGGTMANGILTIDLEIREGEWFPEDEHGPSIKVFAFAEKGKPAQIPGPMIRISQGNL